MESHLELDRDRMAGMVALREAEGIVGVVTLGVVVDRQVEERYAFWRWCQRWGWWCSGRI
jgi:hypothetical protein